MVELKMTESQDPKIEKLLAQYPVFSRTEQGKLHCDLTNHELPYKLDCLQQYLSTKKFLWEWELHKILQEHGQYFDDIGNNLFGCKLTMKTIARDPKDLSRHLAGKKFQRALVQDKEKANSTKETQEDEPMEMESEPKPLDLDEQKNENSEEASEDEPKVSKATKRKLTTKSAKRKVKRKRAA